MTDDFTPEISKVPGEASNEEPKESYFAETGSPCLCTGHLSYNKFTARQPFWKPGRFHGFCGTVYP